jgi:hypothetical protein
MAGLIPGFLFIPHSYECAVSWERMKPVGKVQLWRVGRVARSKQRPSTEPAWNRTGSVFCWGRHYARRHSQESYAIVGGPARGNSGGFILKPILQTLFFYSSDSSARHISRQRCEGNGCRWFSHDILCGTDWVWFTTILYWRAERNAQRYHIGRLKSVVYHLLSLSRTSPPQIAVQSCRRVPDRVHRPSIKTRGKFNCFLRRTQHPKPPRPTATS